MIKKSLLLASLLVATLPASEDLGSINIISSTIDDKFSSKSDEVSTTSTLGGDEIDAEHAENVQEVLDAIPGITTEMQTGDSLKIHIRGVENQMYMGEKPGVAVVIDGVPVFERTGRVNIDLDNIESIRVIKGGASYLFGDDALSGAVVITTKRGAKYKKGAVSVEGGSFGYQKILARKGYADKNMNFHIQASERKGEGFHEDSDYKAQYLNGKLLYYINDSSDLNFGFEFSKREKDSHGTVGGVTEAQTNPQSIYLGDQDSRDYTRMYDVELMKLFLTYSKEYSKHTNLLVNGYIYTDSTEFMSAPQTKDATGTSDATLDDEDYVYDNFYEQTQRGIKSEFRDKYTDSAAMIGLDLRANEYKNRSVYRVDQAKISYFPVYSVTPSFYLAGDDKSNDTTDEYVYAIYGEYKYALSKALSLTTNLRYDKIVYDYSDYLSNNYKEDFQTYNYRLGMNYKLSKQSHIYINHSTGSRAPTVSQLYAGDVSTWGDTVNNPDLEPETSKNYEIGFRTKRTKTLYEASVFQIDRDDFIMKTSGNYGDTATSDQWDNVGGAQHRGFELSTISDLSKEYRLNLAYTYLDARYTQYDNFGMDLDGSPFTSVITNFDVTGNRIPRTSYHTVNMKLKYKATQNFSITGEANARSSYFADDLNAVKIAGHGTLNLLADYVKKSKAYEVSLFARVDNVFDKFYYNTARSSSDRNEDGVFDAEDLSITVNQGRSYRAGVSVKF